MNKNALNQKLKIGILLSVCMVVFTVIFQVFNPASAYPAKEIFASGDPYGSSLKIEIAGIEKDLLDPNLKPEIRKLIQQRLAGLKQEAAKWATQIAKDPKIRQSEQEVLASQALSKPTPTNSPIAEGLMEYEILCPKNYYKATCPNAWVQYSNNQKTTFYAGNLEQDADQGVVYVYNSRNLRIVRAPAKEGYLKIIKLEKNKLVLQSRKGNLFYFDINAEQFVSSLDSVSPIIILPAYP